MDNFPPSSDMVKFEVRGDKVGLYCLICAIDLGEVTYLNEALVVWSKHRATYSAIVK